MACSSNELLQAILQSIPWAGGPRWDEAFPLSTAFTIGGVLGPGDDADSEQSAAGNKAVGSSECGEGC